MTWRVEHGDCLTVLASMDTESGDACVCDPPYGLSREPDITEVLTHWLAGDDYKHRHQGFMGKSWDSFVPGPAYWREVYRVLRPGGHVLAFGGTRTHDLLCIALRLAGFEIRDRILSLSSDDAGAPLGTELAWIQGAGFPKSLNVSKAIDQAAGHARGGYVDTRTDLICVPDKPGPVSSEAKRWDGYGTALKPSHEPIVVARRPLSGTVVQTVLTHGTGALNIDGCRVATGGDYGRSNTRSDGTVNKGEFFALASGGGLNDYANPAGRWPSNVVLTHDERCVQVGSRRVKNSGGSIDPRTGPRCNDVYGEDKRGRAAWRAYGDADGFEDVGVWACVPGCPVRQLDDQAGHLRPGFSGRGKGGNAVYSELGEHGPWGGYGDSGGPSRFFPTFRYVAKASSRERNMMVAGLLPRARSARKRGQQDAAGRWEPRVRNWHTTVKPVELMRWLVRLVTPPGGTVLDPFAGSGSTGIATVLEGVDFIGIEQDAGFVGLARARIAWWEQHPEGLKPTRPRARPMEDGDETTEAVVAAFEQLGFPEG